MGTSREIRIALDSLGCKLNQAETEFFARQLTAAGYKLVASGGKADIYILNTCTVTHVADRKSRQMLRQARRRNPAVKLVAMGCYAERTPRELAQIDGVNLVLGNEPKFNLLQHLQEIVYPEQEDFGAPDLANPDYDGWRTRTFIKVQDGCNSFCTYCIVPFVRGREESVPVSQVVAELKQLVASGCKEAILTGTEIGSYRSSGINLSGLVERILAEADIARIRLSSLQPPEITPEFIALWRDQRLCPHFHLSLQSGSDTVLRRMKRRYATADYQQAIFLIRENVPDVAITTDVIVGFPGETEKEFQESFNFCRQMEFARIHVFSYSPREGTEAALMTLQVEAKVKKQRSQKMLTLAKKSSRSFSQRFVSKTMTVLWEKQAEGIWSGLTGNYIKVYTRSDTDLTNRLVAVKLESVWQDGMWGDI